MTGGAPSALTGVASVVVVTFAVVFGVFDAELLLEEHPVMTNATAQIPRPSVAIRRSCITPPDRNESSTGSC
jgi:hypothetical protein